MADIPPILVEIQADVASLKKGLADAQSALTGLDKKADESGGRFAAFGDKVKAVGATLGIAFAGTAVFNFLKSSVIEANAASASQERLATLLTNTGMASKGQIEALIAQAEALETVGVVTKDNILVAQSQLATFDLAGSTIRTLTPAILDYVTAEKGAAAGADDFRSMTNGLAQALQGNFASLTKTGFVLDEATKKTISSGTESERAAAIVSVLNSTYKGFNETLRDTNPLQAAINDLGKLKGDIGEALIPVIDQLSRFISNVLIPGIKKFTKFVKENADALKMLAIIIGSAYTAFKIYKGILVTVKVATQLYTVATTLARGATLASIASTNGLAASMLVLNAAMRANPIGLVVTALALVAAAFVTAYKKSETFRDIVNKGVSLILKWWGLLLEGVGKFLSLLSKVPGMGWAKGIADGAQKAADKLKLMADAMTKINQEEANRLAGVRTPYAGTEGDAFAGDTKGNKGGGLTEKEISKLGGLKKKVKETYKDMNEIISEAGERAADALVERNENIAQATQKHAEKVADLQGRYNEQMAAAQERYDDKVKNINKRANEQTKAASERYQEEVTRATSKRVKADIEAIKTYNKQKINLEKDLQNKLEDLKEKAANKTEDLITGAAKKQAGLIEQSIARLTNAFASGTTISIVDVFKTAGSGAGFLGELKKQLDNAKKLQEAAAYLAGQGYSQSFIEQIVKAGPEAGLALVQQLQEGGPELQAAIRSTFTALETIQDTGLDALAASMNTGANLATSELRKAYNQVAIDLAQSLNEVDTELTRNMAEQQKKFDEAMTAAAAVRDEHLAENFAAMTESIAESDKALKETMAKIRAEQIEMLNEATEELTEARLKAQEELDKGLVDAQKVLNEALVEAQKNYEEAIDKINEETTKKLDDLKKKLAEAAAAMAALSAAAAANVLTGAPTFVPFTATPKVSGGSSGGADAAYDKRTGFDRGTNVYVTANTNADPSAIASAVLSATKYGNAVIPAYAPISMRSR